MTFVLQRRLPGNDVGISPDRVRFANFVYVLGAMWTPIHGVCNELYYFETSFASASIPWNKNCTIAIPARKMFGKKARGVGK